MADEGPREGLGARAIVEEPSRTGAVHHGVPSERLTRLRAVKNAVDLLDAVSVALQGEQAVHTDDGHELAVRGQPGDGPFGEVVGGDGREPVRLEQDEL